MKAFHVRLVSPAFKHNTAPEITLDSLGSRYSDWQKYFITRPDEFAEVRDAATGALLSPGQVRMIQLLGQVIDGIGSGDEAGKYAALVAAGRLQHVIISS